MFRIGHGYDVHALTSGSGLVLGGVTIDCDFCFVAHSDGDVLIHALCDALLGAIAAGDIGRHFPDTDPQFKNIDSGLLLEETDRLVKQKQYAVANIDITIIAQQPKMSSHIISMVQNLSDVLHIDNSQINIKATTTENLGFTGREEGIAVHAVVMLYKNKS